MFTIELDLFSIGAIVVPIHTKHVLKLVCIPNIGIIELVKKNLLKW
jgi:hypothetical protein